MLNREDNDLLTRTGPATTMGNLFRQYWIPVLLSKELPHADCPPVRVKILGEELIALRDSTGRAGLLDPVCPHRGANLFFGRNEDGGIRCAYHGWKFDVEGNCLDLPSVPTNAAGYREKIKLGSYPVREWGDYLWAYMGPVGNDGALPPLPQLEFALLPPAQRFVSKKLQECNWAQACEGGLDTAHFSFLHMDTRTDAAAVMKAMAGAEAGAEPDRLRWLKNDGAPRFTIREHPAGLLLGAARQADADDLYWRISQFLMPCHGLAPNAFPGENYHGQTWVPIDDHTCWVFCYTWNPERALTPEERAKYENGFSVYAKVDAGWKPLANRGNDYLIDRDAQARGSFTGIAGVAEQDACIQDSQGFIADRTREHLVPTDLGIMRFRRLMLQAARGLAQGATPPAVHNPDAYALRSGGIATHGELDLDQVMMQRFGHEHGYVGGLYGLGHGAPA